MSLVPQAALNSLTQWSRLVSRSSEPLLIHDQATKEEAMERAMKFSGLSEFSEASGPAIPSELSGGMRQRAIIATWHLLQPGSHRPRRTDLGSGR